jgi:hypothetical protein
LALEAISDPAVATTITIAIAFRAFKFPRLFTDLVNTFERSTLSASCREQRMPKMRGRVRKGC